MILQANTSSAGSYLAVREDDFTSTGTSARTKPTIQGTGGEGECSLVGFNLTASAVGEGTLTEPIFAVEEETEEGSSKSSARKGQKRGKNDRPAPGKHRGLFLLVECYKQSPFR